MDLTKLADEIQGLVEKATPGPCEVETVETSCGTCHKIGKFPSNGVREETAMCLYADGVRMLDYGHSKVGDELLANAQLFASLRNNADAIVKALREAEAFRTRKVIGWIVSGHKFVGLPEDAAKYRNAVPVFSLDIPQEPQS